MSKIFRILFPTALTNLGQSLFVITNESFYARKTRQGRFYANTSVSCERGTYIKSL